MLTHAQLKPLLQHPDLATAPRTHPERCLNAADLLAFGRCPARWAATPDGEDPLSERGPSLVEWLLLAPGAALTHYARRPATYEAMVLRCPVCNGKGTGAHCRKCNARRRNVVEPRPWSVAATSCAAWAAEREAAGQRIIASTTWEAAEQVRQNIQRDPAISSLVDLSDPLQRVQGLWRDEELKVEFPLEALITLLPQEGLALDNAVVGYTDVRNADPNVWENTVPGGELLLQAALALLLVNHATNGCRNQYLWIVAERDTPNLVCRRRAASDLLNSARDSLFGLLNAYARCLAAGTWPSFEPHSLSCLGAWAETHVPAWHPAGSAPGGLYFAPRAAATLVPQEKPNAKA